MKKFKYENSFFRRIRWKISIISRYIYYDYEPYRKDAICYSTKKINIDNKEILLEIRVVPGYKHFRQRAKLFYKDADAIALVYDITKKENFEEIKEFWYPDIKINAKKDTSKKKLINKFLN